MVGWGDVGQVASGVNNLLAVLQATKQRDPMRDMPWLAPQVEASQQALGLQNNAAELFKASLDPTSTAFKNVRALQMAERDRQMLREFQRQAMAERRNKARGYGGVTSHPDQARRQMALVRLRDQYGAQADADTTRILQGSAQGQQSAGSALGQTANAAGAAMNPLMMKYALSNNMNSGVRYQALAKGLEKLFSGFGNKEPDITPEIPQRNPYYQEYDLG